MRLTADENISLFKNAYRWIDTAGNCRTLITQKLAGQFDQGRCCHCGEDLNTYIELNYRKWRKSDKLSGKCQNHRCRIYGRNIFLVGVAGAKTR